MNSINKFKVFISILLSIILMFSSVVPSVAAPVTLAPSPAEHKQIINQFINEIKDAQNRSLSAAQSALEGSSDDNNALQIQIDLISSDLQAINDRLEDYADIVQGLNAEDRQVRLTFNFLNLVRSNLYTLGLLTQARTDIERIQLLDEFFRTRIDAADTLTILENLLQKYNT